MTTTKKILTTTAAIAFAATLSSCELKKWEENTNTESNEINSEISENISTENIVPKAMPENPKMKMFEEKQAEMWKLFQEFEKTTPEFKTLQDEINAIFSSWKQPTEDDMKKVTEIDWKIRALFTPEMTALDEELRKLWNEIFSQPKQTIENTEIVPAEKIEDIKMNKTEAENIENVTEWEQPMMILK